MGSFSWIAAPPVQTGELFESWFLRFCRANYFQANWLSQDLGVIERFRRGSPPDGAALEQLQRISGVAPSRLLEAHLDTFAEALGLAYDHRYKLPFFGLNDSHTTHKVCPECLAEDTIPYIRLQWALDITCICPVHRKALSFVCNHCDKPLRLKLEEPNRRVTECVYCDGKIQLGRTCSSLVSNDTIVFQEQLLSLQSQTTCDVPRIGRVNSEAFANAVQKLFYSIARFPLQAVFSFETYGDEPFHLGLIEDRFAFDARRCNALTICGWVMQNPLECLEMLQGRVCDPGVFDPTRAMPMIVQAVQQAVVTLQTGVAINID